MDDKSLRSNFTAFFRKILEKPLPLQNKLKAYGTFFISVFIEKNVNVHATFRFPMVCLSMCLSNKSFLLMHIHEHQWKLNKYIGNRLLSSFCPFSFPPLNQVRVREIVPQPNGSPKSVIHFLTHCTTTTSLPWQRRNKK